MPSELGSGPERRRAGAAAPVLHRARWVLPIHVPPIPDGAVVVGPAAAGRQSGFDREILAVGPHRDLAAHHRGPIHDHGEVVLLPALVNAHTHLELSALAGRVPSADGFGAWLLETATLAADLSPAAAEPAIDDAIASCLDTGTGLVGDVTGLGRAVAALARSRLAARIFHEVLAFDPRRAESALAEARTRLVSGEERTVALPMFRHSLAPHAPYSVSMRLLRLIRGVNAREDRPTSIHLAESPAEEEFMRAGTGPIAELKRRLGTTVSGWEPPGDPTVVYLDRIGWFEAPQLVVHVTQISPRGIEILRRAPVTACLCPRSNRALGVGVAPAAALQRAGVPLALGTDSLASAPDLNLFSELAAANDYDLAPAELVHAATRGGARALGFGSELGELAPGRLARMITVAPAPGTELGGNPYAPLLGGPGAERIRWVD